MNSPARILIVEDERQLLKALGEKLTHEGFEIIQARNGQEGLALALDTHPDLILLDIVMPVMDGITMIKELRKDPWGSSARVLMLTNLTDAEKVSESIESGAFDYLIKADWNLEDLLVKIKSRLR